MNPKLSICIPTYNFGQFIGETLKSILNQAPAGLEIVVVDGASTDNTSQVVGDWQKEFPSIKYFCLDRRGGIDRDMAKSVDLATGDYCWLFSSDDIMKPGALQAVLDEIQSGHDLYLGGLTLCDFDMNVVSEHPVSRARRGEVFDLKGDADRRRYFRLAETTTALFSFMGSLIFKRERWNQHELEPGYVNSLWAHVVRILRMIPDGLKVKYLGESLLYKRSGNDSFMERGLVHRYAMAIDGYHRIANDIFGVRSLEARHTRRVLVNEFPPRIFFLLRDESLQTGSSKEIPEIDRLVHKTYCDTTIRNLAYRLDYRISFTPICRRARARIKGIARKILGHPTAQNG